MTKFNSHNYSFNPRSALDIIQKLIDAYKLWHKYIIHLPKPSRYTLGFKIDSLFTETIEFTVKATHLSKAEKLICLTKASVKLDLLKFFLQIAWEIKALDNKKYINLSQKLDEIGKMIGGWIKSLK